mgnify:CR=1 FL=1
MWTRKEVKERGRESFKRNYWKCVIVALIISILAGGGAMTANFSNGFVSGYRTEDDGTVTTMNDQVTDGLSDFVAETTDTVVVAGDKTAAVVVAVIVTLIVLFVVLAIVFVIEAFIINPLYVGGQRFFVKNLDEQASVSNLGYAFDNNYKNIVKTMFLKDLYVILWTLLFIVPGIVKMYEYHMIPYLLTDDPTMTDKQAFSISKEMMRGNKWKTFVLDLSFLGWHLLGALTLGLVEAFYVMPYEYATNAALYRKLLAARNQNDIAGASDEL